MSSQGQVQSQKPTQTESQDKGCSWAKLPPELRNMVFDHVEESIQAGKTKASVCASVSKEWHRRFEPQVFRRLTLTLGNLHELETIVTGRRQSYVRHIWFRFEKQGRPIRNEFRPQVDCSLFEAAIYQLFLILGDWPKRSPHLPGIALELTAFSPDDVEYSIKGIVPKSLKGVDLTVESETLRALYEQRPSPMRILTFHEMETVRLVRKSYMPRRVSFGDNRPLPRVDLITDVILRRQTHASFFLPYVQHIVAALPSLASLAYEPHGHAPDFFPHMHLRMLVGMANRMAMCPRRLQIFAHGPGLYGQDSHGMQTGEVDGSLGRLLGDITQNDRPEEIAISFVVDARDFLWDFREAQINRPLSKLGWPNLTSLVLTSPAMSPHRSDEISPLLETAARAARHMPKLRVMELYYVDKGHQAIFTYTTHGKGADSIVRWHSTWWRMSPALHGEWKQVAAVHGAKGLSYKVFLMAKDRINWAGSVVSLLHTRRTVVHSVTYGNMMDGLNDV
ncbi:hypothetical protein BBK36DRAFT_1130028 [Trichoderma citrinoviride]|uniref:DUF6546 domain-containing protein n=1 Tax=Trichoderma citrinoviride TaxID=58853 RepID=A0A2T4AYX7_9HYPO|nr:hypothetical protein BBK36DRAFT_1130028 [Trichoderma citrinoviride]PTB62277.1 hypothetical protein BBK36DRAFT_1130028 [Trichoderma citrinoviride]